MNHRQPLPIHRKATNRVPEQPTDWFQRHVLEKLDDLGAGQRALNESHQRSIEGLTRANREHQQADAEAFAAVRQDIESLKLVKTIVFSFVGMILVVVAGALIAMATNKS